MGTQGPLSYREREQTIEGIPHHTNGSSSRGDAYSEVFVTWEPLNKVVSLTNIALSWLFPHLDRAMRTMGKETTHANPSYYTLSQEDHPISALISRSLQTEAQTEIPQPCQDPSDTHYSLMEFCVEKPAHDKR